MNMFSSVTINNLRCDVRICGAASLRCRVYVPVDPDAHVVWWKKNTFRVFTPCNGLETQLLLITFDKRCR